MPHDTPLIATIVIGLCLAFIFGAIATRLKISPLVGYLLAGVIAGPHTPGFVADQDLILQLAEIGVILLMFGVGLHFSLKDLLSVKAIAVPGALAQIAAAAALGTGLGLALGWDVQAGLVFGLALSTASTVVLLRAMQERRLIDTERGRIAVGWLIVEDLAMVMALVLLPAVASVTGRAEGTAASDPIVSWLGLGIGGIILLTIAKVVLFVALMLIVGRKVIPWLLNVVAQTGSRELFRLGVLAIALGVAFGAAHLFGVSFALGAFFAGMVMSESELSHRAAEESLPLRDAFAVLFFISVGMLFDPMSLLRDPLPCSERLPSFSSASRSRRSSSSALSAARSARHSPFRQALRKLVSSRSFWRGWASVLTFSHQRDATSFSLAQSFRSSSIRLCSLPRNECAHGSKSEAKAKRLPVKTLASNSAFPNLNLCHKRC